jgi:DNA-binding transcriptional ArsR family regulator
VLGFRSSAALASAYGVAVLGTMIVTTLLGILVARAMWNWSWWRVVPLFGSFALVEMAFLAGNITKIPTGGWVPLAFAVVMFTMFITWRDGRQALRAELEKRAVPDKKLPELLEGKARVPGTAVFLVSQSGFVPPRCCATEHNKVHHEQIVILHIEIQRASADPLTRVLYEERYPGVFDMRACRLHGNTGRGRGIAQRAPGHEYLRRGLLFLSGTWCGAAAPGSPASSPRLAFLQRCGAGRGVPYADLRGCGTRHRHKSGTSRQPRLHTTIRQCRNIVRRMKTPAVIVAPALAHEYRLRSTARVAQGLKDFGGAIGNRVGLVPSSLTFHLQSLQRAGLITQVRASRQLIYSADYTAMNELVGYLTDKCCSASGQDCATECAPRIDKSAKRKTAA